MSAGDQVRQTAAQARMEARIHREQAAGMHKTAHELERLADELTNEAARLDARAHAADTEEKRSQDALKKLRNQKIR